MTDVDGDVNQVTVTATNAVPGAARVNFLDNTLTMIWEEEGLQTVTIQAEDRYDSNLYTLVVDVYDSMPLLVGSGPDADVRVDVSNVYIGEVPDSTMFLNKNDVTITSLTSTWQICSQEVCMINEIHDHDITMKSLGWTFDPSNGQLTDGMGAQWYVKLVKITALASNGDKFEYKEPVIKWTAYENAPGPETMSVEEVDALVAELDDMIEAKNTEIEGLEEGSTALDNANAELEELEAERANACEYTTCVEQNSGSASDVSSSGLDMTVIGAVIACLLYTSPSPRDKRQSRMPSSA